MELKNVLRTITPAIAREYLAKNTHNRTHKQSYVDHLAKEIAGGRWKVTHQGIAFDVNGVLLDGQHRLMAIIKADRAVMMYVAHGIDSDAQMEMDVGNLRRAHEQLTLTEEFGVVTHHHLAALRAMVAGVTFRASNHQLRSRDFQQLLRQHWKAINWASVQLPRSAGVVCATMRGCVARAWYHFDEGDLERFCTVVRTGISTFPDEQPIVLLVKFLTQNAGKMNGGGSNVRVIRAKKITRALYDFHQKREPKKLLPMDWQPFPLDGDPSDDAGAESNSNRLAVSGA